MSTFVQPENVVIVCDENGPDADAMRAFLRGESLDAVRWYGADSVDDVDRGVRSGGIGRVVLPRQSVLLEAIWGGEVDFQAWSEAEVQIDVIESSTSDIGQGLALVAASWQRWRRGQRRRQALAGLVLSALAVGIAFGLICLAG